MQIHPNPNPDCSSESSAESEWSAAAEVEGLDGDEKERTNQPKILIELKKSSKPNPDFRPSNELNQKPYITKSIPKPERGIHPRWDPHPCNIS